MKSATIKPESSHNLQISEDTGIEDEPVAVLLFTPTMSNTALHYHVELNPAEASVLRSWLNNWLAKVVPRTGQNAVNADLWCVACQRLHDHGECPPEDIS